MIYDFLRFWRDLVALNVRKTLFRWGGRQGLAPCQMESDSGVGLVTDCGVAVFWNEPKRFRRVCPNFVKTDRGWKCSLNSADVRPHWGRALLFYAGLGVGLVLVSTGGAYGWLRHAGYQVRYSDVVWPPAWSRFDLIRSQYYFDRGMAAMAENRSDEAGVALSIAYEYDPTNYEAGFNLAQLWKTGQAEVVSDRLFGQLLKTHPEQGAETARIWAQALLRRGDFRSLARLAGDRLLVEPLPTSGWFRALIFSTRCLRDTRLLTELLAAPQLSAELRSLLQVEVAADGNGEQAVSRLLTETLNDDASIYARYFQLRFLIRTGKARRALELLATYDTKLPANERMELSLGALEKLGEKAEVRKQVSALMAENSQPQLIEILASHLILYPDQDILREVAAHLAAASWGEREEGAAATAALLCAAGESGDWPLVASLGARLQRTTNSSLRTAEQVKSFFAARTGQSRWGNLLPALPMLRVETVYAVLEQESERKRRQL